MMSRSFSRVFPGGIFVINSNRALLEMSMIAPSDSSMLSYLRIWIKSILMIDPFRTKYTKNALAVKKEFDR